MLKNTRNQYGSVSKIFHWGIFILVCITLLVGFFIDDFPKAWKSVMMMGHKSTGILILCLIVLRLVWRWSNEAPSLEAIHYWEKLLAQAVHMLLYVLLLAMPLSGWIMSTAAGKPPIFYGLVMMPFPGVEPSESLSDAAFTIHQKLAYAFLIALALHIIGALKHHFIDKNDILKRIM